MKKRILALVLLICMIAALFPATAFAEDIADVIVEPADDAEEIIAIEDTVHEKVIEDDITLDDLCVPEEDPANDITPADPIDRAEETPDLSVDPGDELQYYYYGTCGDNLNWTLTSGTLTISGSGAMTDYSYSGYAPWYQYNYNISNIVINSGVTSIGNYAFYFCRAKTCSIPSSVTRIGSYAFYFASLTSVTIPSSVTAIGDYAFFYTALTSVSIPASVSSIGNAAFSGCTKLTGIEVDANNPSYASADGVLFKKDFTYLLCCPGGKSGSYEIPNGVWVIDSRAFYQCSALTDILIPNSVISINATAFYACSALTDVTIPSSVTSLGSWAFEDCSSLTRVVIPSSLTRISWGAFCRCSSLASVTIPYGVTYIEGRAFEGCSSLASVTIPSSVTDIDSTAFTDCSSIMTAGPIDGGYNLEFGWTSSIPSYFFSAFTFLESITLPDELTSIGSGSFSGCASLTSITVPSSVTNIESGAFANCSSLTDIEVESGNRTYYSSDGILFSKSGPTLLCFPAGKGGAYRVPSNVKIADSAFSGCSALTSLTIPAEVTSIGYSAFEGCSGIVSAGPIGGGFDYEFGWTSLIPNNAFSGCNCLTEVTFPSDVTSIGNSAFLNCSSLNTISLPEGLTSIGYGAFSNCSSLSALTIPEQVTSIDSSAFYACSSLTDITIPYGVSSIESSTFSGCSSLSRITLPETLTTISWNAFNNCINLTELTIPEHVTSIGTDAFYNCRALTSITLPVGITSISGDTFYNCSSLASVTIPIHVTSIGGSAFGNCSSLTSITLPDDLTSMGRGVFAGCSSLSTIYFRSAAPSFSQSYYSDGYDCFKGVTATVYYPNNASGWSSVIRNAYFEDAELTWQSYAPSFLITYYANGGTGAPPQQEKVSGVAVTLSDIVPIRTGYRFLGWATDTEATDAQYQPGDIYTTNANLTLYAVWGEIQPGWYVSDGKTYYYDEDRNLVTGWYMIDGAMYYFDESGVMQTGWQKLDGSWYFFDDSGIMTTGWHKIGSNWFFFDDSGVMLTKWQKINGTWYYFSEGGVMQTGWQKIGATWYYFSEGGAMQTGWQKFGGGIWYYFFDSGAMATGWLKLGETWYYFSASGAMQTGLVQLNGTCYFFSSGGGMVTGWQKIDADWYYFSSSGAMVTGWQKIGDTWFFFDSSGVMATGWQTINDRRYYFGSGGAMQTGWQMIDGEWYYFSSGGAMQTGWVKSGSDYYYMDQDGLMVKDTVLTINDINYRFYPDGRMYANAWYHAANGSWYYYLSSGAPAHGYTNVNGKYYYFDDGEMMTASLMIDPYGSYYTAENGAAVRLNDNGWSKAESYWFYCEDGRAVVDGVRKIGSYYYGFGKDGVMITSGTPFSTYDKDGSYGRYRAKSNGKLYCAEWYQDASGDWYYYCDDAKGARGLTTVGSYDYYFDFYNCMQRDKIISSSQHDIDYYAIDPNGHAFILKSNGWTQTESYWYYCIDGVAVKNQVRMINGKYYGFNKIGRMFDDTLFYKENESTGTRYTYIASRGGALYTSQWKDYGGYTYYLGADGMAYTGTRTIDGKTYYFDEDGRLKN